MGRNKDRRERLVVLGSITGAHGIQGWVRVHSHTEPREGILEYSPWLLGSDARPTPVLEGAKHGKAVIARLEGVADRDEAESLAGRQISVERGRLPEPGHKQYYWADLIGLEVVQQGGKSLGTIHNMMATGANDVMVVRDGEEPGREQLVPFLPDRTVLEVDLESGRVTVDWEID